MFNIPSLLRLLRILLDQTRNLNNIREQQRPTKHQRRAQPMRRGEGVSEVGDGEQKGDELAKG